MHKLQLTVFLFWYMCLAVLNSFAQQQSATVPGNGNPIIPGYFADPTVRKFGDTYYIYATTDGNGGGHGPSQVWTSKDFVNWTMHDMNWPTSNYYWAPDVINGNDGKFYMYYCQPVDIYGASSASPTGPWTPLMPDGKSMIPNYFIPGVITLDGQTFKDDDGKIYMFWGTWGIYPDHGCGVGLLNADMHTFAKTAKIPNTIAKDFFEAPFMFKRKGIYYFTYSSGFCEDSTYRVQYAISKTGPMGSFEFGKNNPVLSTNSDGTIHGPGHESVVQVGDDFYMVYHRHNNPHSNGGYHRQVCADKIVFDSDGNIEKIVPTHLGVGLLGKSTINAPDEAYQKKVTASSFYNENYKPSFAVDNNNGTLWKPADNSRSPAWITIDLGSVKTVQQVLTQFEYATWYYQYLVESSVDGKTWKLFADRRENKQHGSPMVDSGNAQARFIRLTITGTEYPGLYKAIWNVKVYGERVVTGDLTSADKKEISKAVAPDEKEGLLVNLNTDNLQAGEALSQWTNNGALGGSFTATGKPPVIDIIAGKKAVVFIGTQSLESTVAVPRSLAGNNSYTVWYEVYADLIKDENPVLSWTNGESDHRSATFGFGSNKTAGAVQHFGVSDFQYKTMPAAGKWHQVVVTFDGSVEKLFVDGEQNNAENKMLFLQLADKFIIGAKTNRSAYFSGAISSLKVYNRPMADSVIKQWALHPTKSDIALYLDAAKLNYGRLQKWTNNGDAGGAFLSAEGQGAEVTDIKGKIAVSFNGNSPLVFNNFVDINNKKGYSVVLSVYQNASTQSGAILKSQSLKGAFINAGKYLSADQWHYVIKTVSGNAAKLYVDGAIIATISNTDKLTGKLLLGDGFNGAVSNLVVYKHSLSSAEIKQLSLGWKQNYHPPIAGSFAFKAAPTAVTPGMVEMEAPAYASVKSNLQYDFINETDNSKSSGWQADPHYISYGLSADKNYSYSFKVKDNYGNVSSKTAALPVSTASILFNAVADGFTINRDFVTNGVTGTIWNGLIGGDKPENKVSISDSLLTLESKGSNWDGNLPYGPFLYRNVSGDFVAEVEVADVSGLKEKKVAGNSDMGLMVRKVKQPGTEGSENLIQNSIFPAWNCGNMLTNFKTGDRMQTNTQTGWNYNRYLQIQKSDDVFYIRSGNDGIHWTDLPGSPVVRPDLIGADLQIGLYHSTYGPHRSYVKFSNFKLISRK
ncbi:family 43 glycosylhydrolase [Mucilaginibacter gossypii]|uniref:Concanavalin A-like lectin/glucanases superfamily protein n=2 Tax=Mucilaginibacter TaxID=423349 RepID=A0A1G7QYF1_9SPHI|nr:family 43 glycosylhydrolase [Mucilaginibacter gossypii]SDG03527.1 Concanavalin A-like lectin/glucanases superfamily protein [Mucilaginibacter gossypii]